MVRAGVSDILHHAVSIHGLCGGNASLSCPPDASAGGREELATSRGAPSTQGGTAAESHTRPHRRARGSRAPTALPGISPISFVVGGECQRAPLAASPRSYGARNPRIPDTTWGTHRSATYKPWIQAQWGRCPAGQKGCFARRGALAPSIPGTEPPVKWSVSQNRPPAARGRRVPPPFGRGDRRRALLAAPRPEPKIAQSSSIS